MASAFDRTELSEEDLREIRKRDVLNELMGELGDAMPVLKRVLIDERDTYLAQRIREADGERIVAVVGAGHVAGMRDALLAERDVDLTEIDVIPTVSPLWKWVGWGIPAMIIGSIVAIGFIKGPGAAGENALFWFLANAVPTGIGAIAAFGHPVTVVAAALSAPFTSLTPVIGAGYVAAFVQTWMAVRRIRDHQLEAEALGIGSLDLYLG